MSHLMPSRPRRFQPVRRAVGLLVVVLWGATFALSCRGGPAVSTPAAESPGACATRLQNFVAFVNALPSRTVVSATRADLPVSTLGAIPGPGPVLDVSAGATTLDGTPVQEPDLAERLRDAPVLYVATAAGTDVETLRASLTHVPPSVELRLLVRTPKLPVPRSLQDGKPAADAATEASTRLLLEPDPRTRERIAAEGYASLADCSALTNAVTSVNGRDPRERWPLLKAALGQALPGCDCARVDTAHLRSLVAAEQRASGATLSWVPLSFLKDERCGASMPLRSMNKLIQQIEAFDAEFAGDWKNDAMKFADVVTNDRLRVYFCNALPGETLAAKERSRATLYLRVPGPASCEPWRFEPLSPGAPMGTWRRSSSPSRAPLAFHYWQASEEIRVFGPVDEVTPSRPTDAREWACEETHHLLGMDDDSLQLDNGRWFFDEAACRLAPEELARPSPCVSASPAP